MLRSCAWCLTPFPPNDAVEAMPVGQRIAFDEGRGRLWVVCRRCERWNLAPIETRWEAIEACARAFRDTRVRVSTAQVGLARLADGTELVRIGAPLPEEFAAWRYGDQFGRRRTRAIALGVGAVAAVGTLGAGALAVGATLGALLPVIHLTTLAHAIRTSHALMRQEPVRDPAGGAVLPIGFPRLVAAGDDEGGWGLMVPYSARLDDQLRFEEGWWARNLNKSVAVGSLRLTGPHARQVLARYVPRLNRAGAPRGRIHGAVALIAESGGSDGLPRFLARHRARFAAQQTYGDSGELAALPAEVRLALEMAAHEESERAMLEGELVALEAQWQRAEEEAAIGDDLLLSPEVRERLAALRRAAGRDGE